MAERRTGLGKGLGALIPSLAAAQQGQPDADQADPAPTAPPSVAAAARPVDLLFGSRSDLAAGRGGDQAQQPAAGPAAGAAAEPSPGQAGLVAVPGTQFALIPIAAISPNPRQPREVFDQDELEELADSIKEVGLLQPIVVRAAAPSDPAADGQTSYELVMGERRWRACELAGLTEVPAIVRQTDDSDLLLDALLENLHRAQLNPLEEAAAYRQLLDDFGCTPEELSARVARSRPRISNTLRLLKLPPLVQRRLAAGVVSAGHARALLGLEDAAAMERLAQRIVAEGLSVRTTEELVALGDVPPAPKPNQPTIRPGTRHEALDALQERLADRLDTRVRVALGKTKGRLTIEFASVADLNRIVAVIAPEDPGVLR
ncbi:MAG: ParB/RepB/Spo0J family partition protein [Bifidobacteriaceae bacterium]|jgi:ParB family chromosome partitioning protein|nr:ParB/RepB/Spo0J family partition protein [Bifidobacteriaceae bacterium]